MTGVFLYIFSLIVPVFYKYKALWQVLSFDKQTWSVKRLNIRIYTYIVFISLMVAKGMLIGLAKKIEKSFKEHFQDRNSSVLLWSHRNGANLIFEFLLLKDEFFTTTIINEHISCHSLCTVIIAVSSFDVVLFDFLALQPKSFMTNMLIPRCVFAHHLWLLPLCVCRWERLTGALHIRLGPDTPVRVPPQALSVGSKSLCLHVFSPTLLQWATPLFILGCNPALWVPPASSRPWIPCLKNKS